MRRRRSQLHTLANLSYQKKGIDNVKKETPASSKAASSKECEALGHDKVEQYVEVDWGEGNNEFVATNAVEKEIQEEPELVRWRSVKGHAHARGSRTQRRWISICSCQALPANRPFTSSLRRHIAAL